ncbi:hypothetical protein DNTS_027784 [Danionella cerebrum]|uniref:AF4/FMR2 C-terminal homology domain-containing protein n=1 Tax=Danionella cerebrum TaxID=2873325 RepID=A0A553Q4G0_9TELE|nr:hypothetical protein DNTS_027784 [Danionella translucida]
MPSSLGLQLLAFWPGATVERLQQTDTFGREKHTDSSQYRTCAVECESGCTPAIPCFSQAAELSQQLFVSAPDGLPKHRVSRTNKGDALANRVQNTLGNYDEMKELLTNHSNQSHLVGIPKNTVPQTPVEKPEQPGFFTEAQSSRAPPLQSGSNSTSMPPPPPNAMPVSTVVHGHQGKKPRSSDWSRGGHCSSSTQALTRGKHNAHEQTLSRHDLDQEDTSPDTSGTSTSLHSSRKQTQAVKDPSMVDLGKSPAEQESCSYGSSSPLASTSLLPSGLSTPTFPQVLHCKPSSAVQQKPTAYVRPMDGQDQVPNDSPELKPPMELVEGYSLPFGGLLDTKNSTAGVKTKIPKLTLPQSGELPHWAEKHHFTFSFFTWGSIVPDPNSASTISLHHMLTVLSKPAWLYVCDDALCPDFISCCLHRPQFDLEAVQQESAASSDGEAALCETCLMRSIELLLLLDTALVSSED